MYHLKYFKLIFIIIVCISILILLIHAKNLGLKAWTQTTENDFIKGKLDSVVITRLEDGEVQLPHPLVKTRNDSIDNTVLRFAIYDDSGNYLHIWIENEVLFAGKYSPNGVVLIEPFQVNKDTLEKEIDLYAGCFNDIDQGFVITWSGPLKSDQPGKYYIFAQYFDATGKPIDTNKLVNEIVMGQASKPSALFDDFENYWIFWNQGDLNKGAIYYQKYSSSGEKVGGNQQLNPENFFKYEYNPSVAKNSRGEFVVAWSTIVDQEPISNYSDVYLRFFDKNGVPKGPPQRVDDDPGVFGQWLTDICIDHHDNLLLVWLDRRGITDGNFNQVYAQLYNVDGISLNRNRQITSVNPYHDGGLRDADIVLLPDGQFQISWEGWHMGGPWTSETVVNQWKIVKVQDGELTSSIFDAGPGGADWHTLNWSEGIDTNLTTIQFKIRSGQTIQDIEIADWYGPVYLTDFYAYSTGQVINSIHDSDRFLQYKAFFATLIPGTTPILKDVSLWFATLDSIAPQTPTGLSTQQDTHQIQIFWTANNEPDLKMYKLYRGNTSHDYDIYWTKEIDVASTKYLDTNVVPGTTYFYAISAIDSNLNESPLSAEVFDSPLGFNFYVDDQATPGGDGSIAHPFSTISNGLEAAIFGDTVKVLPGSYPESILIGKGVALIGSSANLTKIVGPADSVVVQCSDFSLFKGFTIINNSDVCAIRCDEASPLITDNVLINYGHKYSSGIDQLMYSSPRITKNIISSFGTGIRDQGGDRKTISSYIGNNIFVDCKQYAIRLETPNSQIINNTIVQEDGVAIRLSGNASDVLVMNNIIYFTNDQNGTGILLRQGSVICKYNNVVAAQPYSNCEPGEGSISAKPLFRQEHQDDYRLQSTSPCVDAGNPDPEFNDYDGSRNDMGAYGGPNPIDEKMVISNVAQNNSPLTPKDLQLFQNYPNPFNPSTTIEFDLPKTSEVTLKIFNILGEEVATLVSDRLTAGSYSYDWHAGNLASGVYLYRLSVGSLTGEAGEFVEIRKMVLIR